MLEHCPGEGQFRLRRCGGLGSRVGVGKHALLQDQSQAIGDEDEEKCSQVYPVLLPGFAVDTVIIKKGKNII